jgi:excisionase family DNA binding protein
MDEDYLLDPEDAARILRISRSYVYTLIRRGDLPFFLVGGLLRIRRADVDRYILNQALYKRAPRGGKGKKE